MREGDHSGGSGARLPRVILVADVFDEQASPADYHQRHDLEKTDVNTLRAIVGGIKAAGFDVTHYQEPRELSENAPRHRNDVVLTTYGGSASRNRLGLVPAICETHGVSYVGLDMFGQFACQDKEVAKRLARDCGLQTPNWRIIRTAADVKYCARFTPPYIVKPLLEGSSIGISQENIIWPGASGASLAEKLLSDFGQPVLVEEFVAGGEVAFVSVESADGHMTAFTEIQVEGEPDYFKTRAFDAKEKMLRLLPRKVQVIDSQLSASDRDAIFSLLDSLGHYGFCRVDGRLRDGRFHFVELTPDAWLGPTGQLAAGLVDAGRSYADVLKAIIDSAQLKPRGRSANG